MSRAAPSRRARGVRAAWVLLVAAGCGPGADAVRVGPGNGRLTALRRGTVVAEACALDTTQSTALASAGAQRVLREVVLLCLRVDEQGAVAPADPATRAALRAQVAAVRALGFRVTLGFTLARARDGAPLDPAAATRALASTTWQARATEGLAAFATTADGLEVAPPLLENGARAGLTAFVAQLSARVRPAGAALGLFAPPSVSAPSDLPGGDAFDLAALATLVDRVRVMTLDFSCCGAGPGPTLDPGWAVDAMRFAQRAAGGTPLDVSVPLYGYDFGAAGATARPVTFLEALALRDASRARESEPLPTGARSFFYTDASGARRMVWFDDGASTLRALLAWDPPVLPASMGVLYYGLGAEDPALWATVAEAAP